MKGGNEYQREREKPFFFGVQQGSTLGLVFIIFINDLLL